MCGESQFRFPNWLFFMGRRFPNRRHDPLARVLRGGCRLVVALRLVGWGVCLLAQAVVASTLIPVAPAARRTPEPSHRLEWRITALEGELAVLRLLGRRFAICGAETHRTPCRNSHGKRARYAWRTMNKAFTRETDAEDEDPPTGSAPPAAGVRNYVTLAGYNRLRDELLQLIDQERPRVVEVVHWAAGNGDRSENGDYLYGKKRLREIDRRIRFLTQRLEIAEVTDPSLHHGHDQVFFGATVRYATEDGQERQITILGVDEADSGLGQVSWISPIAQALLRSREGDVVKLLTPSGSQEIEVLRVRYPAP
jgi:transcription elongation factor GreB